MPRPRSARRHDQRRRHGLDHAGFPADLRITLNQARYADGNMVVATVNGALAVTGPLARDPLVSGNIDVVRAEITVPENLGGGAAAIDVKHMQPPAGGARRR